MLVGIIIGSIILALVLAFFALLFYIYTVVFHSPKKWQNNEYRLEKALDVPGAKEKTFEYVTKIREIPYQDLFIKSYDGLKLHAYLYENKSSDEFILMFNGYRGIVRRDYAGKGLETLARGKNLVLIDQRAHGQSKGHSLTLGRKEQRDVVSWVNFIKEKYGESAKITVSGVSMGASTVIFAADKLPADVKVFADSPYASEKEIIINILKAQKKNPKIFWPLVYLAALFFAHVRLKDDAVEYVSKAKCKILIIHGTGDTIVPIEMSERMYEANKEHVQLTKFEGLDHALAFLQDREKYLETIFEFIDK